METAPFSGGFTAFALNATQIAFSKALVPPQWIVVARQISDNIDMGIVVYLL